MLANNHPNIIILEQKREKLLKESPQNLIIDKLKKIFSCFNTLTTRLIETKKSLYSLIFCLTWITFDILKTIRKSILNII